MLHFQQHNLEAAVVADWAVADNFAAVAVDNLSVADNFAAVAVDNWGHL